MILGCVFNRMANTLYTLFYNEKWAEAEERLNNKSLGVGELLFKDVRLICACRERWTHSNLITSIQKDNWTVLHIVGYKNAPLPLVVKLLDKGLDVNAQLKVRSKIRLVLFSRTILHKNWPKFKHSKRMEELLFTSQQNSMRIPRLSNCCSIEERIRIRQELCVYFQEQRIQPSVTNGECTTNNTKGWSPSSL